MVLFSSLPYLVRLVCIMVIRSIMSPITPHMPKLSLSWETVFNISIKYVMQSQLKLPTDDPFWSLLPNAGTARYVSQHKSRVKNNTNPESFFLTTHGYPPILLQLLQISNNEVPLTKPCLISKLNALCRITEIQLATTSPLSGWVRAHSL